MPQGPLHQTESPCPSLLPHRSLQPHGFSAPCFCWNVLNSKAPNPCLLLTYVKHDYFCAVITKKETWPLPLREQETEKAEEEELEGYRVPSGNRNTLAHKDSDGHHLLISLLKDCTSQNDIHKGRIIHMEIAKKGLFESRVFAGNALVDMYAKCGMLAEAVDIFENLPFRTVVAWTALIAGYAQYGHAEDALGCFEQMQCDNVSPNRVTYLCILKACANLRAADKCGEIHLKILEDGLENDTSVGTALVGTYAKCGLLEQAQEVFDKIAIRNVVSFGALLSGYVHHGLDEEALECFEQMQREGLYPNAVIFISVLNACGSMVAINIGREVHSEVVKVGFLDENVMLANALLDMYAKCSALIDAQDVFNKLQFRDLVSWNSLIAGYAQHDPTEEEAFAWFEKMQRADGFSPNILTFAGILKACRNLHTASRGQQIHSEALKRGISEKDVVLGNALVEMYSKCSLLAEARCVFDMLSMKSVVQWNALIAGYAKHGCNEEALKCYEQMQIEGFSPNAYTLTSILKAYTSLGELDKGQAIHFQLEREGLLGVDMVASTALIDMYAKCGLIENAQEVFDKLLVRDVVSWSALITGYADEGCGEHALECYEQMQLEGFIPNLVTFVGALKACGSIGVVLKGREIHAKILQQTFFGEDILVGTSLIDMYGKCGSLVQAKEVFCKLPVRNEISWNALMAAYSQVGEPQNVFRSYHGMITEGFRPTTVTFTIIFNTCSHAGLLDRSQLFFEVMNMEFDLSPTDEHYHCMIDMFGRAGQLENMVASVLEMPVFATLTGWHIVLAASQRYEPDTKAFGFLGDMYIAAGSHENTGKQWQ